MLSIFHISVGHFYILRNVYASLMSIKKKLLFPLERQKEKEREAGKDLFHLLAYLLPQRPQQIRQAKPKVRSLELDPVPTEVAGPKHSGHQALLPRMC